MARSHSDLTVDQLTASRAAVLRNAESLLDDAQLLLDSGRYPRALSLAVLAFEECAKVAFLAWTADKHLTGVEIDWKDFHRRIRSHNDKLMFVAFMHCIVSTNPPGPLDPSGEYEYLTISKRVATALKDWKQRGLYAEVFKGASRTPDESISEDVARTFVQVMRNRIEAFRRAEELEDVPMTFLEEENSLKGLASLVGRCVERLRQRTNREMRRVG